VSHDIRARMCRRNATVIVPQCPLECTSEAAYRQALALVEELGMHPLQAHCHHGLGALYAQTGRWDEAHAALAAAIALYHSMDRTFWLPQAKAALAQVA